MKTPLTTPPSTDAQKQHHGAWSYKTWLLILIALLLLAFGKYILPYLSGVLGAFTIYVLVRNQQKFLVERKRWRSSWAATLITLEVIFLFLLPLTGLVFMLIDVLSKTTIDFNAIALQLEEWRSQIEAWTGRDLLDINPQSLENLSKLGTSLVQFLIASTYSLFINSFVLLFLLFFMLQGYKNFETAVKELLPFTEENKAIVSEETLRIVKSNAIGIPLMALVQGFVAYVGYVVLGVPTPLFYAVLTAASTVIPVIGTMIVWIPLCLVFLLNGSWVYALLLFLYGFIIIGGSDNVARFLLQKQLANIHPLITIFGVFLGLAAFGFWGVIFGPLLISILFLLVNLYRHDYIPGSVAQPRITITSKEKKKRPTRHRLSGKATDNARINTFNETPKPHLSKPNQASQPEG